MTITENKPKYKVILSKEVVEFLREQNPKAVKKILSIIDYVAGGDTNKDFFKKLDGTEIWEFRVQFAGIAYRMLAFWDTAEQAMIITTHGFIKKTQKTPQKEIDRAERKRKEYFNHKNNKQ